MAIVAQHLTLHEFLRLPESEPALEYWDDGTVLQKMSPQGQHSWLQFALTERINRFAVGRKLARAFPELRATYSGASHVPDVAVYLWERIPTNQRGRIANVFEEPPDIAVEIVSPEQSANSQVRKCLWYVGHGVRVALMVDPADDSVVIFRQAQPLRVHSGRQEIDLTDVLPGFRLTVDDVFHELDHD